MAVSVALLAEFLAAKLTVEGARTCVHAQMVHHVAFLVELLIADKADQNLVHTACLLIEQLKFRVQLLLLSYPVRGLASRCHESLAALSGGGFGFLVSTLLVGRPVYITGATLTGIRSNSGSWRREFSNSRQLILIFRQNGFVFTSVIMSILIVIIVVLNRSSTILL